MLFAPQTWGSGGLAFATSTTGNVFLVTGDDLALPEGYVSGSPLSGTLTFASATFASLGITPGSYVYSLPNDTVTVKFGTAPEPGTLALLGLGLAGLVATRKRARLSSWTSRT